MPAQKTTANVQAMDTCRICLRSFRTLKFKSDDIGVCMRCVNTLNDSPEPAIEAQNRIAEMLARGMQRTAQLDLQSEEEWKRRKAQRTLDNLESAVAAALPGWLKKLLADTENSTRDFKIMRAHRRGLLRMDGPAVLSLPGNWQDVRQRILRRDDYECKGCRGTDRTLDIHHIVHRANFGTNQQANLLSLCRACHQKEHPGIDLGSNSWAAPPPPPPAPPPTATSVPHADPSLRTGPSPPIPTTPIPRVAAENTHRQHADITTFHAKVNEVTRLKWAAIGFCGSLIPLLAIFGSTGTTWWTSFGLAATAYWLAKD